MAYEFQCDVTDRVARRGSVRVYEGTEDVILTVEFLNGQSSTWMPAPPPNEAAMTGAKAAFKQALVDGPRLPSAE